MNGGKRPVNSHSPARADSKSGWGQAQVSEESGGMSGVVLASGSDRGAAREMQQGNGEVAERRERLRGVGGVRRRLVFAKDHIPDPVQAVLNQPVCLPQLQ